MTAALQRLLTLTYDSKDEAALLNYFHAPLYYFITSTKQPASIGAQYQIHSDRTTDHHFDKTQLTPFQCKHIARLHKSTDAGLPLHASQYWAGRRCENASNIFNCEFGFHNYSTYKLATATLL